jgi:hypothetical protein
MPDRARVVGAFHGSGVHDPGELETNSTSVERREPRRSSVTRRSLVMAMRGRDDLADVDGDVLGS